MDARGLRLEVVSPCSLPWERMRGDERVRFCGVCQQNVYNVEAMTADEAARLIAEREGQACVRIRRRPDGTVVVGDCWARLRAARRKGIFHLLFMIVVVGWVQITAVTSGLAKLRMFWLAAWRRPPAAVEPVPRPVHPGAPSRKQVVMGLHGAWPRESSPARRAYVLGRGVPR